VVDIIIRYVGQDSGVMFDMFSCLNNSLNLDLSTIRFRVQSKNGNTTFPGVPTPCASVSLQELADL
jgi:hypothetical protein